ncbi:hypothetical protein [Nocardia wallacei]|uniref:hypothetical protein n=1 Tax=Nocardia wallacei TaxID=480035 RepID=UPI0024556853|nr:hypothetical protein [Nocardia wallacei]
MKSLVSAALFLGLLSCVAFAGAGVADALPSQAKDGCVYLRVDQGESGWRAIAGLPVECGADGISGHIDITGPGLESIHNAWNKGPGAEAFGRGSGQVCAHLWEHPEGAPQSEWTGRGDVCVGI